MVQGCTVLVQDRGWLYEAVVFVIFWVLASCSDALYLGAEPAGQSLGRIFECTKRKVRAP